MRIRPAPLLAALALAAGTPVLADDDDARLGDETKVAEAGECEAELSIERSRRRGEPAEHGRVVELACGIGWRSEIALGFERRRTGGERAAGLDVDLNSELAEARPGRIGWVVSAGVGAAREPGLRWRRSEYRFVVEATWLPADGWLAEFQLGTARDRSERLNRTLWQAAAEHALGHGIELRAEVGSDDRSHPLVAAGLRWLFAEDAYLKLTLGTRGGRERERIVGVALKLEF